MVFGKVFAAGAAAVVGTVTVATTVVTNTVPEFLEDTVDAVNTEVDNCFSGGCDPTRPEVQELTQERIDKVSALVEDVKSEIESTDWEKYEDIYSNPMSYQSIRTLWGEFARLADENLLDGALSQNFGHVTNKHELIADLEQQGVLALGLEISHAEYIDATRYAALSVAAENPAPLLYYFKGLAIRSYEQMVASLEQSMDESSDKSQEQLQAIQEQFSVEYLTTVLAAYVSTGEVPQLSLDASLPSVKVGMLTYSRAERTLFGDITTPNTHQPYMLIDLPTVSVKSDDANGTSGDQAVDEQPAVEQDMQNDSTSTCVSADSRSGWQQFSLPGSFTKVESISGEWSVDTGRYASVGAFGHSGADAEALAPYDQLKYDQEFPFGALIIDIPTDGYGYTWVSQPQQLPKPITETAIRINDADNALGDNEGFLEICFSN